MDFPILFKLFCSEYNIKNFALDLFEDYVEGVPSVILFHKGKFIVVPEPDEPDPIMWYRFSYLQSFINQFLQEKE